MVPKGKNLALFYKKWVVKLIRLVPRQCHQIAALAIQLKDAVETIREQVMNIE